MGHWMSRLTPRISRRRWDVDNSPFSELHRAHDPDGLVLDAIFLEDLNVDVLDMVGAIFLEVRRRHVAVVIACRFAVVLRSCLLSYCPLSPQLAASDRGTGSGVVVEAVRCDDD